MAQTNDLDAKIQKMQALLERVIQVGKDYDVTGWGKLLIEIETLLKEAEEAKHDN